MGLAKITPLFAALIAASTVCAQVPAPAPDAPQTQTNPTVDNQVQQSIPSVTRPIAIIPLDSKVPGHAA